MRILVDFKISKDIETLMLGSNVFYRPDLGIKSSRYYSATLQSDVPDVLITRSLPPVDVIEQWRNSSPLRQRVIILVTQRDEPPVKYSRTVAGIPVYCVHGDTTHAEIEAFILAEQINSENLYRDTAQYPLSESTRNTRTAHRQVALVGCGIVNLITAYYLLQSGYRITLHDGAPDPRIAPNRSALGCTHGGDDARMFSLSETRHHFNHGYAAQEDQYETFFRGLGEHGWLCCDYHSLNGNDNLWRSDFENVPAWLTAVFNDEIISFNQESRPYWEELQRAEPGLFTDVGYIDRVIRVYSTKTQLEKAILNENRIGSFIKVIDSGTLGNDCVALKEAVDAGEIAGAIEVVGFTVNIHKFSKKLLNLLEQTGAEFHWNSRVERVERQAGVVCGLVTENGFIEADHYVLSPGAYGNGLLRGLQCENKIASVIGMWLRLPNLEPKLNASLKITRSGYAADSAAEGANVIVGVDEHGNSIIHVSSGHGYVGENPNNISAAHIDDLFRVVEETAQRYLPSYYAAAQKSGLLRESIKYCVRPWTASGLGLFETTQTAAGGLLIVTGGHNTGGFAQSPSTAYAVLSALRGEAHAMHRAYHPNRLNSFLDHSELPVHAAYPLHALQATDHITRTPAETLSE